MTFTSTAPETPDNCEATCGSCHAPFHHKTSWNDLKRKKKVFVTHCWQVPWKLILCIFYELNEGSKTVLIFAAIYSDNNIAFLIFCKSACAHIHVYAHTHIHTHTRTHVHTHTHMHACTHTHTHTLNSYLKEKTVAIMFENNQRIKNICTASIIIFLFSVQCLSVAKQNLILICP